jgi:hypothetical protein
MGKEEAGNLAVVRVGWIDRDSNKELTGELCLVSGSKKRLL